MPSQLRLPPGALLFIPWILFACASATPPPEPASSSPAAHYVRGAREASADTVIVFIHGVIGDAVGTWTNPQTGSYWPKMVADDPAFAGADVFVESLPSPPLARSYTVDELGVVLGRDFDAHNVISNHKRVIFLCHSMGGLVVRAYLLKARPPAGKIAMLYFFSTPTTGSEVADLASAFSSNPQLVDLRKMKSGRSGTIDVWQSQWLASDYRQTPSYCAYEVLATHGFQIVQKESATNLCNRVPEPIRADHMMIVKPAGLDDEPYVAFRNAYRETMLASRSGGAWSAVRMGGFDTLTWNDIVWIGPDGWLGGATLTGGGEDQPAGGGVLLHTSNFGYSWTDITPNIAHDEGTLAGFTQTWNGIGPITAVEVYPRPRRDGTRVPEGWIASVTGIYQTPEAVAGRWERMTPDPSRSPFSQFVRMANIEAFREIYAVGWAGIAHWKRGREWELQKESRKYLITGVATVGDDQRDVWAVGRSGGDPDGRTGSESRGAIYYLDWPANEWRMVSTGIELGPGQSYADILPLDHDLVVAVGDGGLIVRGRREAEGWRWERRPSGTSVHLASLAANGGALWVVGSDGVVLVSFDGGLSWNPSRVPAEAAGKELHRIRFFGNTGWIVGHQIVLKQDF